MLNLEVEKIILNDAQDSRWATFTFFRRILILIGNIMNKFEYVDELTEKYKTQEQKYEELEDKYKDLEEKYSLIVNKLEESPHESPTNSYNLRTNHLSVLDSAYNSHYEENRNRETL